MNIEDFIKSLQADTYPEKPCKLHTDITKQALDWVLPQVKGRRVLDVGCGQGVALKEFAQRGFKAQGTTVNDEDYWACKDARLNVWGDSDMHDLCFTDEPDIMFDLIWARHVLEHSPIPLYVLRLFREMLAEEGILYIEVPAPDTVCNHEYNKNHYSVLGARMWSGLIDKAGLQCIAERQLHLTLTDGGKDQYFAFICKKK